MASTLITPEQDQLLIDPDLASVPDEELCARAGNGDLPAFAALYDRHERRVFSLCLGITAGPEQASDATQEAFLELLGRARRNPDFPGEQLRMHLLEAARDASVETLKPDWIPVEELPDPPKARFTPGQAGDQDDAEGAARGSAHDHVLAAIAGLRYQEREVLALRELEDCSDEEISAITVVKLSAVAGLISSAAAHLCDQLHDAQGKPAGIGLAYGTLIELAPIPALRTSTLARANDLIAGRPAWMAERPIVVGPNPIHRIPSAAAATLILLLAFVYSSVSDLISGPGVVNVVPAIEDGKSLAPLSLDRGKADTKQPAAATPEQTAPAPDSGSGQPGAGGNDQPGNGKPKPGAGKPGPSGQDPPDPPPNPVPVPDPPPPPNPIPEPDPKPPKPPKPEPEPPGGILGL